MLEDYTKIYIDPEEPLNSLLDKIQTVESDILVVIIHKKSSIFVGQVNLELIKNYSQRAGKRLIFISNVAKTRKLLTKVGFKVYSDLEELEADEESKEEVETQERKSLLAEDESQSADQQSKNSLLKKLIGCGAGLLLLGLVWFYFAFSVATVEVTPVFEAKNSSHQVRAVKGVEGIQLAENKIPLVTEEVKIGKELEVQTTGQQKIGVERATGVLALINDTRQEVVFPAGTEVATQNGIKFRTVDRVTIPPAEVDKFMGTVVGMRAGRAEVNIEAVNKGVGGNVSQGRIVELIGGSYPITVVNPEDTRGGEDEEVRVVTKDDLERGLEKLERELKVEVEDRFEDKFSNGFLFFSEYLENESENIVVEAEVGDIRDKLRIVSNIKTTGLAVKKEELKELVLELYQSNLTDNFKLADSQVIIEEISIEEINSQEIILNVESSGQVKGEINEDKLFNNLVAQEIVEIKNIFDKMEEIADYTIEANGRSSLPRFSFGIDLIINEPQKY
ncbi:baseplate J/gp47 family protein [Natroniella acetigena]|uniref:baseplate J/gp47 family protein n=1 Tax=Natroniella acetigena TaxID=52004 RepID=UPI00200B7795|nr:baseplate J/gp47 family protein [Natroniella acetigena]MCK8828425.1 baseplate J/gp47 family protein [Natroniella acetigena]